MKKYYIYVMMMLLAFFNVANAKKLIVGSAVGYPPFEFVDEKGKTVGFDIDLIDAIAKRAGYDGSDIVNMPFPGLIPSLVGGKIEVIASTVTITDERKKTVDFTKSYYKSGISITVRSDNNTIKGEKDLIGKKLAVSLGTTNDMYASKVKDAEVTRVEDTDVIFSLLITKKVDAVITEFPVATYYATQKNDSQTKVVGNAIDTEEYGFVVSKKNPELLKKLNDALDTIKKDGTYDKIYKKWFGNTHI